MTYTAPSVYYSCHPYSLGCYGRARDVFCSVRTQLAGTKTQKRMSFFFFFSDTRVGITTLLLYHVIITIILHTYIFIYDRGDEKTRPSIVEYYTRILYIVAVSAISRQDRF